jgi:hypothetical protein
VLHSHISPLCLGGGEIGVFGNIDFEAGLGKTSVLEKKTEGFKLFCKA